MFALLPQIPSTTTYRQNYPRNNEFEFLLYVHIYMLIYTEIVEEEVGRHARRDRNMITYLMRRRETHNAFHLRARAKSDLVVV